MQSAVDEAIGTVPSLTLDDVDAYWVGTQGSGMAGMTLSQALRIGDKPVTRVENYCATGSEALRQAAYAVASGAWRQASGRGQVVDSAIYEAVLSMMESVITEYDQTGHIRERTGAILPNVAPSRAL